MSSSILRYGQVIRIRSYQKSNTFLTSKSYTDPNLYFQIYNIANDSPLSETLNISNYRQSLFEVLPTSSFQINDQMNSQKIQAKKAESAPRAKTEEQQFKAIIAEKRGINISFGDKVVFRHVDSQYYIYGSFDCATSGIGAFKIELKKQLSEKIIFQLMAYRTYQKEGDEMSIYAPFEIYHCQTQCYLSYCYQQLFLDKVHLEGVVSKGKLGQQDTQFALDPPKINQFFKLKDQEHVGDDQIQGINRLSNIEQVMLKAGRYLIINENIPKRVFKLVTHNQFEMKVNRQKIRNHDIVYFIHTENDQYIVPHNFSNQIFLKKRIDEPDQTDIFDGLWEIEEIKTIDEKTDDPSMAKSKTPSRKDNPKQPAKKYGNQLNPNLNATYLKATVGNPIVEGQLRAGFTPSDQEDDEQKKSGKIKFVLRHLASGRLMYVSQAHRTVKLEYDPETDENPIFLLLEAVDSKLEDGSLVKFTYKKRINSSEIVKLQLSKKSRINGKQQEKQKFGSEDKIREADNQQSRIIQQQDNQSNPLHNAYDSRFQIDPLQLVPQSSEHGFRIYKINQEVKQLCLFVLSSQEIISKFTSLINSYQTLQDLQKQLTVFLLNNVANVFKNLIGFIYDCDYNIIAESGNNPIAKRQRIFDEVGMIELTTRTLQVIHKRDFQAGEFLHELEKQNKISQYRKIRNIYQLGYKLLQSIAAGNDLLKVKISRYNNKYLYQIIRKENRIVYRSIQEVLEGNQLALEQIKEQFIQKLIQNLDQNDPDPADLYFLSRLCLCRERTVHKNQVAVFKSFYEQKASDIRDGLSKFKVQQKLAANKFKFRQDQQKMQILSIIVPPAEPQYRTLSQLFEECNLMKSQGGYNPDKNHWAYFMQYLNLLADLCVQRNPYPLKYIQLNLPLKTLVAFLHETTVKKNLLFQPFIRLVHHAFVENSNYEQISRITKVKDWQKLNNFQIPKAQKQIPDQLKKTMSLIFDYIKRINKKPFQAKKSVVQSQVLEDDSGQGQPEAIELDIDDKNRLINVKTFLQILKSTLNLGFWPEIEKMKMIIPYLLKILRFDIEYSDRAVERHIQEDKKNNYFRFAQEFEYKDYVYSLVKQQLKLNKPNIVLLVECKILAARILNIIIDYEFNARVSLITKHFKDVMEVDTDLSKYTVDKIEFIKKWNKHQQYELFAPQNKKEGYLSD